MRIAYTLLWVHDQDEALAFYTEKLGWEVRVDVSSPSLEAIGGSRSARRGSPMSGRAQRNPGAAGDGRGDGGTGPEPDGEGQRGDGAAYER